MSITKTELENKDVMNRTLSENINKLEEINNFKSNMTCAMKEMMEIQT